MIAKGKSATALAAWAAVACLTGCQALSGPSKPARTPQTYIVFFHFDGAGLTPAARKVVEQAAAGIKLRHPSTVGIAGFADKIGSPGYNQHLSERRIAAVEQALADDGVDPKLFLRIPLGESEPVASGTADRRVEIRLAVPPPS